MMYGLRQALLNGAYQTGAWRLIERSFGGMGAILMGHRVVKKKEESLAQYLTVTESFLDQTIAHLRRLGMQFVSMSDLVAVLRGKKSLAGRAVVLTFDDGYRDNLTLALPILEKHQVPATLYAASGAFDRTMDVWYLRLEYIINRSERLSLAGAGLPDTLPLGTIAEKIAAYAKATDVAHRDIARFKAYLFELLPASKVPDEQLIEEKFMNWQELQFLARHPLITIGAHTESHAVLAALSEESALDEMIRGRDRLTQMLGCPIEHFAYPYGGKTECGAREFRLAERARFVTAVTTRYGNIYREHRNHLQCLPRMTLGGPVERTADMLLDLSGTRMTLSKSCLSRVVTD